MEGEHVVKQVLRQRKDYYEMLGITRNASEAEIRVAYKKLAIQLHPDKNKHPMAEEAFKKVGLAHSTLIDSEKRRIYDRGGEESVLRAESGGGGPRARRHPHAEDFLFEDMMQQFFGFAAHRNRPGAGDNAPAGAAPNVLLMFMPILFFFLMVLLIQFSTVTSGPFQTRRTRTDGANVPYSLTHAPSEGFVVERTTSVPEFASLRVTYYVKRDFMDHFGHRPADLRKVEVDVLRQQRDYYERRCNAENVKRRYSRARDNQAGLPESCVELERFRRVP